MYSMGPEVHETPSCSNTPRPTSRSPSRNSSPSALSGSRARAISDSLIRSHTPIHQSASAGFSSRSRFTASTFACVSGSVLSWCASLTRLASIFSRMGWSGSTSTSASRRYTPSSTELEIRLSSPVQRRTELARERMISRTASSLSSSVRPAQRISPSRPFAGTFNALSTAWMERPAI